MSVNNAKEFLKVIRKRPENFYLIHYSCQNLNDDNASLSPRITSIAVTHYSTGQTVSFSTHYVAEILSIRREDIRNNFDIIEKELLKEFYDYVRDRRDKYWVHWNMRNSTYGFEHLELRYRALGGQDYSVIPVERRLNLNDLIAERYGSDYATHPKLKSLMILNGGTHRDFLEGGEEVRAFENQEYIKMHKSTLSKIGAFYNFMKKMSSGKLKTNSRGWGVKLDNIFEGRLNKAIGLVSGILGLSSIIPLLIWIWQKI